MQSSNTSTAYAPGVCNINPNEVKYRRKAAFIGFGLAAAVLIISLLLSAPNWLRAALLFLPLYVGVVGYLQVRNKFCVKYGSSGQQNADGSDMAPKSVSDETAVRKDKQKARTMNTQAFVATVVICLLTLFLPA